MTRHSPLSESNKLRTSAFVTTVVITAYKPQSLLKLEGTMPELATPRQNFSTADMQAQLDALKQENIELRSRLQICEQSQAERQLDDRDSTLEHRLLEATAEVVNALLTASVFDKAVNTALQIMGAALDTDCVWVIEYFDKPADSSSV